MKGKRKKIRYQVRHSKKPINPEKLAGCEGKIRYNTYAEAKAAADKAVNAHAYKCDFCPFYHKGRRPR